MGKKKQTVNSNKINIVIHNDRKEKRRRRRSGDGKTTRHGLGNHAQNLQQHTRTVMIQPPGPDMSALVNQVLHNKKVKNDLLEDVKDEKTKPTTIQSIMNDITSSGGVIKKYKDSVNIGFPKQTKHYIHTPTKIKKKDRVEELNENDLHKTVHHNNHKDNVQDLHQMLLGDDDDAIFPDMEAHNNEGLNEKAVKTKRQYNKTGKYSKK